MGTIEGDFRFFADGHGRQADNKALGAKLAEKIAEERAKALLKSVEGGGGGGKKNKRSADDSAASAGEASADQGGKKKKHKQGKKSRR